MENNTDTAFSAFISLSEDMSDALRQLQMDDSQEIEEPSAEESRQVLRWLNNLPSTETSLDEWLGEGALEEALAKATSLSQLVKIFIRKLKRARKRRADILRTEVLVENAAHAAASMTQAVIEFTLSKISGKHPKAPALEAALKALPPQAEMRQTQSVKRLVDTIAAGMERASGKNVAGKTAPEQLVEMSTRMQKTMRSLRSIDSLEPPAREESIELAREILRRLKNLGFSDKPIREMIDAGRPEEKADFAKQIEEAADIYKNLVQEAAQINPNVIQDQRIKDANDAVSAFTHGVKLMAAKEMPNSIASAQQIGADTAHSPEEWDKLHSHTVGRLVKSMEGGVEKAANDIQADQEEQRQQDEKEQDAADTAMQSSDSTKRKKKRRRRSSGKGGKKQQKEKIALEADDYVLKQGRFNNDAKAARKEQPAHVMPGLTPEALAAVKLLGGALLNLSNQAKAINMKMTSVSSTDKIMPDDKTITQRVIEAELQKGPRNLGGQGV